MDKQTTLGMYLAATTVNEELRARRPGARSIQSEMSAHVEARIRRIWATQRLERFPMSSEERGHRLSLLGRDPSTGRQVVLAPVRVVHQRGVWLGFLDRLLSRGSSDRRGMPRRDRIDMDIENALARVANREPLERNDRAHYWKEESGKGASADFAIIQEALEQAMLLEDVISVSAENLRLFVANGEAADLHDEEGRSARSTLGPTPRELFDLARVYALMKAELLELAPRDEKLVAKVTEEAESLEAQAQAFRSQAIQYATPGAAVDRDQSVARDVGHSIA